MFKKACVAGSLCFAFCGQLLLAQVTTGTISGRVTDSTGGVLPGTEVVILNEDTGVSRTVETDSAGRYSGPSLSLGNYRVTTSLAGFQTAVRSGIRLTVSRQAVVNFELAVGAVTQTVEVTGEAPMVETTKGGLGSLVQSETIDELPLNGRDLAQLITLQTGVVEYEFGQAEGGKLLVTGGARPTQNVFFIDGIAIESFNQKTPTGKSGNFLGSEGVQEFRVEKNAYSAEFGRATGGGAFNIATKSGTNGLHGSVFEYLRNDNLDANRWEANKFGLAKPEFKRNQFGGSLGGPIIRDKTFFFANYEALRERLGVVDISSTFTQSIRADPNIAARVRPFLDLWPTPNGQIDADGRTGDFNFAASEPTDEVYIQGRVDHQFSENDSFFGRYTFLDSDFLNVGSFPFKLSSESQINHFVTLEYTRIVSPTVLNTLRAGFTRTRPERVNVPREVPSALLFNPALDEIGSLGVSGVDNPGSALNGTPGDRRIVNSFQVADHVIYNRGGHTFKFGVHMFHNQMNYWNAARTAGSYSFGSIDDFFYDPLRISRFRGPIFPEFNDEFRSLTQNIFGLYFQDDYQVTPRLTLNLGLRYEPATVLKERHGKIANFKGDWATMMQASVDDLVLGNPWQENPSLRNFGPRFGFAWDVFGDGKTALRGGFGIFNHQVDTVWIRTSVLRMPPFLVEIEGRDVPFPNVFEFCADDNPFNPQKPECKGGRPTTNTSPFKMATPYAMQYNLNLQREIMANTVINLSYAGTRGVRFPAVGNINQPPPVEKDGRLVFPEDLGNDRPNPNFDRMRFRMPAANSTYSSFQASLTRQFSQGLRFGAAYTFSRSVDVMSGLQTASDVSGADQESTYMSFHRLQLLSKGLSAFDARNVFSFNYTYDLPFGSGLTGVARGIAAGWQLGGIITLSSGFPSTINMSDRSRGVLTNRDRPDLVAGASNSPTSGTFGGCANFPGTKTQPVGATLGTPDIYFDPCAFVPPPSRTITNLGRSTLIMPGRAIFDFSLSKNFDVTEAANLEFRLEAFNLFNRPNFGAPETTVYDRRGRARSNVGRITRTVTSARQLQFALRLTF